MVLVVVEHATKTLSLSLDEQDIHRVGFKVKMVGLRRRVVHVTATTCVLYE